MIMKKFDFRESEEIWQEKNSGIFNEISELEDEQKELEDDKLEPYEEYCPICGCDKVSGDKCYTCGF